MVGPYRAMFMDEITNGLDSSTAFQIVASLQHISHFTDATILVSLLQPSPETFELFDDIILMVQKKIVYNGPRDRVLEFFEECGFKCPQRKGTADFLQEVISKKDQQQFWYGNDEINTPYAYVSVDEFCSKFKHWSRPNFDEEKYYSKRVLDDNDNVVSFEMGSVSKFEVFKACVWRELLLMKRNSFVYVFKTCQVSSIFFFQFNLG